MNDNMNSKDKPEDSSLSESTENAKFNRANIPLTAIAFGAVALVNIFLLIKPEEKYTVPIEVQQNISNLIKAHNAQSYPLNSLQRDTALDNIISMQFDELKSSEVVSKENINQLASVRHIYSNNDSYAALKDDGSVLTWGDARCGGDSSDVASELNNVETVLALPHQCGFVALTKDYRLVVWGLGDMHSKLKEQLTDVRHLVRNNDLFAAIKLDGSVVSWKARWNDNRVDSVDEKYIVPGLKNVESIIINDGAFAAQLKDGSVMTWGDSSYGGDSRDVATQLKNIKSVYAGPAGFAAVTKEGKIISWGLVVDTSQATLDKVNQLSELGMPTKVVGNKLGFAAVFSDGRVYSWGDEIFHENESHVAFPLQLAGKSIDSKEGVIDVVATEYAFSALKANGKVVTWGHRIHGGDSSSVNSELSHVKKIYATNNSFAALRNDNVLISWPGVMRNIPDVKSVLVEGYSYAVIKDDGSVVDSIGGPKPEITEAAEFVPSVIKDGKMIRRNDGSIGYWHNYSDNIIPEGKVIDKNVVDFSTLVEVRGIGFDMIGLTTDGRVIEWTPWVDKARDVIIN